MSGNSYTSIGSIDERGFIKGLLRKGFNLRNAILELFANCLDANARKVHFQINDDVTRWSDDGDGMTVDDASNMAAMHRENHSADPKRGVSGLGAKPAMILLSGKRTVKVFTRKLGGDFLCITFPWDAIFAEGIYTGKVGIRAMSAEERALFVAERGTESGTTLEFPTSDALRDVIVDNFQPLSDKSLSVNPEDHIAIVFGADAIEVTCREGTGAISTMNRYSYFGAENVHYYGGKQENKIRFYRHRTTQEDRFIGINHDESEIEISKLGKGYARQPVTRVVNMQGFDLVGEFTVVCGLRKDTTIYSEEAPQAFTAVDTPGEYNARYLGEDTHSREFRTANKIRRNNQIIGYFASPDVTAGTARASGEAMFRIAVVQCELRFQPLSNQDNPQDVVVGVQENKNQMNGKAIPLQLTRLVKHYRDVKARAIWASFPPEVRGEPVQESGTPTGSVSPVESTRSASPVESVTSVESVTPIALRELVTLPASPVLQEDPSVGTSVNVVVSTNVVTWTTIEESLQQFRQRYSIADNTVSLTGAHIDALLNALA